MRDARTKKKRYQIRELRLWARRRHHQFENAKDHSATCMRQSNLIRYYCTKLFAAVNGTNYSLGLRNVSDFYSKPKGVYRTTMRCTVPRVGDLKLQSSTVYAKVEFFFRLRNPQTSENKIKYCCPIPIYATRFEWGKHESELKLYKNLLDGSRILIVRGFFLFTRSINLLSRFIYWFCNALCMTKVHILTAGSGNG